MIIGISGKIGSGKDTVGKIIQYLTSYNSFRYTHSQTLNDFESYIENEQDKRSSWQIKKFADKLKDIVCLLIGCTREQLEDQEFKNKQLGKEWDIWIVPMMGQDMIFKSLEEAKIFTPDHHTINYRKTTPRLLLQTIGTDLMRNQLHPNVWVNATFADYKPLNKIKEPFDGFRTKFTNLDTKYPNWIITDCRFPNEKKAIEDKGGFVIRVDRANNYGDNLIKGNHHESETALDDALFDYVIQNYWGIEELIPKVKTILEKEKII